MTGKFDFSFESLIFPSQTQQFFSKNWENVPLLVDRKEPDYYQSLLKLSDFDEMIDLRQLREDEIRIARANGPVNSTEYVLPSGVVDTAAILNCFADGGTLILQHTHLSHPRLARLCENLSRELGMNFQTNLYLTPPNQQGFNAHYDTHDVFILQIFGTKYWEIGAQPIQLPLRNQHFNSGEHDLGTVEWKFTLSAGDLVYIPRGYMHQANTSSDTSLHITLGIHPYTWTDLLLESVAEVCLSDSELRRSLPIGFGTGGFDNPSTKDKFHTFLDLVKSRASFEVAVERLSRDYLCRERPSLSGQVEQVIRLSNLSGKHLVRVRENLLFRLEELEDDLLILANGREIKFPREFENAIEFALRGEKFRVADVPVDGELEEKLEFVRRLVREGILVRAESQ